MTMPASEETYRRQPTLHLVFAISSIAMLLSTVWMVMADHLRPWKQVQREFQLVEREKLEAAEKEKLEEQKAKYQKQIDEIDAKIQEAEADAETRAPRSAHDRRASSRCSEGKTEDIDTQRRFQKADLDSKRSLYDGMIDRGEERAGTGVPEHRRPAGRARARDAFARAREGQGGLDREEGREGRSCWALSTTSRKRRNG